MISQAFKMVAHFEKLGCCDFPGEATVKEMIENTRVLLIDQMGKNFPRAKGHFLLNRWKNWSLFFKVWFAEDQRALLCLLPEQTCQRLCFSPRWNRQFEMSSQANWNHLVVDLQNNIFKLFSFCI
jgi:hypothetical protein